MKKGKKWLAIAVLTAAAATASGCGASHRMSASAETAAAQSMAPYEGAAGSDFGASEAVAEAMDTAEGEVSGESIAETMAEASAEGENLSGSLRADRKLIRNVDLAVETEEFEQLLSQINSRIDALGGYVESANTTGSSLDYRGNPVMRYASLTARIPQDKLDTFLAAVEQGGNVTHKSETTTDVTLKYSDVESKQKSLSMEQERIWALLEKADTLEAVIALEERLSQLRYELESLESQLRLYDNQVAYSTVTIGLQEVKGYTPTQKETMGQRIRRGFSENVERMEGGLENALVAVLVSAPIWVSAVLVAAVVMAAGWRIHRKWKRDAERRDEGDPPEHP